MFPCEYRQTFFKNTFLYTPVAAFDDVNMTKGDS